jgi:hypothetical protein
MVNKPRVIRDTLKDLVVSIIWFLLFDVPLPQRRFSKVGCLRHARGRKGSPLPSQAMPLSLCALLPTGANPLSRSGRQTLAGGHGLVA